MSKNEQIQNDISKGVRIIKEAAKELENEMKMSEFDIIKLMVNLNLELKEILKER